MSTHAEIVPLRTLAKRLPKLNYLKNDRQNLRQLDPENEAKARLKLAVVFCFLRRQGRCRRAHTRMPNIETVMDEIEIELGLSPRRTMPRGGAHNGSFSLAGAAQLRKWVNSYVKEGVKGLLDKHVARMSEEIVRLVLDGKLQRKWRLAGARGYMTLLLDLEEVRTLVRGPNHGGYTTVALSDRLRVADRVSAALIKHGHLKSVTVINPVNRCPTVVVPAAEVERFEREFVSLFAIARQQRRHFMAVKKELQHAGVEPVFNPKKIGATFYRRADLKARRI